MFLEPLISLDKYSKVKTNGVCKDCYILVMWDAPHFDSKKWGKVITQLEKKVVIKGIIETVGL